MARNKQRAMQVISEDVTVDGIDMTVERRQMKNMYIHVQRPDGRVRVSVPYKTTDKCVRDFITGHMEWIKKNRGKYDVTQPPVRYISGEVHYLWGMPYKLEVRESLYQGRNLSADKDTGRMIMLVENGSTAASRAVLMENFYKSEMQRRIPDVLKKCAAVVGKEPAEIKIRDMKTRWGTCNVQVRRIWLNLQLAKHTPDCLDYVMTHELTHLYVSNHGPEFKAYMDRFYPSWRYVKKELNTENKEPVSCSG